MFVCLPVVEKNHSSFILFSSPLFCCHRVFLHFPWVCLTCERVSSKVSIRVCLGVAGWLVVWVDLMFVCCPCRFLISFFHVERSVPLCLSCSLFCTTNRRDAIHNNTTHNRLFFVVNAVGAIEAFCLLSPFTASHYVRVFSLQTHTPLTRSTSTSSTRFHVFFPSLTSHLDLILIIPRLFFFCRLFLSLICCAC